MEENWNFPQSGAISVLVILGLLCISAITIAYCIDAEDEENTIPEVTENMNRVEWSNYMGDDQGYSEKFA